VSRPQQGQQDPIAGTRILVVDDDPGARTFLVTTLRLAGYECVEAATAKEALERIDATISAVVLDNRLPDALGTELLHRLRSRMGATTLPVLLVTGDDQLAGPAAGLGAGATDFLLKPVDPDELVARLAAHLRGQAAWFAFLDDKLRQRASVVNSLFAISPRASAEETAVAICDELSEVHHLDGIALGRLDETGRLVILASRGDSQFDHAIRRFASARPSYLLTRAEQPWIELPNPGLGTSPLRLAVAPMRLGGLTVGLLVLGASSPGSMPARARMIDELLAEAIDFAGVATGLLGLSLHARAERDRRRFDMATLVRSGQFDPAFQPMVELEGGHVIGYEALTRFRDGVGPEARFAEAAGLGLGPELELATLATAIDASSRLPSGTFLSVNVTPHLVLDARDALCDLIGRADRPVVIELTEHDAVDDYPALRTAIRGFDPEVRVSIDDAGAGFASLRHVVMLEPDFVKLDRTWVTGIDSDPTRQAMVAGLSHFARTTGCDLVAEGIEVESERAALSDLDVKFGQGYLLGRPAIAP
jgi:EAL domain-containing protein (putative c-di-GMP-specific phosphodiesterase class I)/DNA-binding response OmpR family regulator